MIKLSLWIKSTLVVIILNKRSVLTLTSYRLASFSCLFFLATWRKLTSPLSNQNGSKEIFPFGEFFKACKVSHRRLSEGIAKHKKLQLISSNASQVWIRHTALHKIQSEEKPPDFTKFPSGTFIYLFLCYLYNHTSQNDRDNSIMHCDNFFIRFPQSILLRKIPNWVTWPEVHFPLLRKEIRKRLPIVHSWTAVRKSASFPVASREEHRFIQTL